MQVEVWKTRQIRALVVKTLVDEQIKEKKTNIPETIKPLFVKFEEVLLDELLWRFLAMRD